MKNTVSKIWNAVSITAVTLLVVLALLLLVPRAMGIRSFSILSGSMTPTYGVGSLVYVKPEAAAEYQPGDPITFMADEDTVVTHRITQVVPDEEDPTLVRYQTKGDANADVDGTLVHPQNVLGKVVFNIPYLGYLLTWLMQPPGLYIAIIVLVVGIALNFLFDKWKEEDEKEEKAKLELNSQQ